MNKISIIIPCYNVERYLEKCVESVINQTYHNLEIILVDDGSTDTTGRMCDEFIQKDSRIRVVHKNNGGLSDARNAGIDVAVGDFYFFVDGDDFIESDACENMISEMQDSSVSLVSAGIIAEYTNGYTSSIMSKERMFLTKEEAFQKLLGATRTIGQSSCNKLFRKNLFETIRYKKGIINEDMEILPRILDICDKVVLLNKPVYHYIKREGSITESAFSIWKYEGIAIAKDTLTLCKKKYPSIVPLAHYYQMNSLNKMLEELIASSNRTEFHKQEILLRYKILKEYACCMRWKFIRGENGIQMNNMAIKAFFGFELTERIVDLKQKLTKRRDKYSDEK